MIATWERIRNFFSRRWIFPSRTPSTPTPSSTELPWVRADRHGSAAVDAQRLVQQPMSAASRRARAGLVERHDGVAGRRDLLGRRAREAARQKYLELLTIPHDAPLSIE